MKKMGLGLLGLLAGCATMSPVGAPIAIERESITYATTPCFGFCPVYTVTIQPDGSGTFEGKQHTAVIGTRTFKASPAQYRAFAATLQPYRPAQGERVIESGSPECMNPVTDGASVDIRWSDPSGGSQRLLLYSGCGSVVPTMAVALHRAMNELPVAGFIGER